MDNNSLILAIIVALVGAIAPTMVAYNALQQSRLNAEKTQENTVITLATGKKVEEVGEQTKDIHTATNGTLSKLEERLQAVTEQNATMQAQNTTMQATIKSLVDRETAAAPIRAANVRETGELLKEVKEVENGNTISYTNLLKEISDLKEIMAGFAEKGMPVVAAEDAPLPVKVKPEK